jgi:hypothetical protein
MGRKTKYNPAIVEKICAVIAETNSDKAAYEAVGISHEAFYGWLRGGTKIDLIEGIARAREAYSGSKNAEVIENFYAGLKSALVGAEEVWTSEEVTTLPNGETVKKESVKTVRRPPAEWAHRIAAPQVGGSYGLEKKDVTSGGKALNFAHFTDEQLTRIVAGERPEDVAGDS